MFGMFDTSADGEPTGEPSHGDRDPRAERLELLVAGYVDRLAGGETLDPGEILAEHPDLGERILEYLKSYVGVDAETFAARPLGNIGDYTLRRQIGRGGMGIVYEAWQTSVERRVALKVLPSGVAADARSVSRFIREAKTAAQLRHPSVVPVYGMGVEADTPYYSMELIEGKTLAQILKDIRERAPGWDATFGRTDDVRYFANVAAVFAGVADGLQHAHSQGVVHRDIKPSNLILDRGACPGANGTVPGADGASAADATDAGANFQGRLRILDFGLAHLEGQESLTATGDFVGTPLYMSPEQARRGKVEIDHRTDIYSVGATLYEMLTLRPPFQGKDHRETAESARPVSPDTHLLAPRPADRRLADQRARTNARCASARGDAARARPPAAVKW